MICALSSEEGATMPHWFGIIDTSSPPLLEGCHGDPPCVQDRIYEHAPMGANVVSIQWLAGEDRASLRVRGPKAKEYLEQLGAQEIREVMTAQERKAEKG